MDSLKTPAEVIDELINRPKFKCRVLRKKPVDQHDLCDYCNHDGEDIFAIAFCIEAHKPKKNEVVELHFKKVCNSCVFFFDAIKGAGVDKDTV